MPTKATITSVAVLLFALLSVAGVRVSEGEQAQFVEAVTLAIAGVGAAFVLAKGWAHKLNERTPDPEADRPSSASTVITVLLAACLLAAAGTGCATDPQAQVAQARQLQTLGVNTLNVALDQKLITPEQARPFGPIVLSVRDMLDEAEVIADEIAEFKDRGEPVPAGLRDAFTNAMRVVNRGLATYQSIPKGTDEPRASDASGSDVGGALEPASGGGPDDRERDHRRPANVGS